MTVRLSTQVLHSLRDNAQVDLLFTDREERIRERINNTKVLANVIMKSWS